MKNDGNFNHLTQSGISFENLIHNKKKLRIGILLDDYRLEAWAYKILEIINYSDYASIELIILKSNSNNKSLFHDIVRKRKNLFFIAYTHLENRIFRPVPDALDLRDAKKILENVPVITLQQKIHKNCDWIADEDITTIKKFDLDVILQIGFQRIKRDILNAAKYGVWSYLHYGNTSLRGSPPGFWETFERMGERGAILQMSTEEPDNGIILYQSFFPCDSLSVKKNNNGCYWKSSLFVPRILKKLFNEGENYFLEVINNKNNKLTFTNEILYGTPKNLKFIKMFIKHSCRMANDFVFFLFFQRQWMLMYEFYDRIPTSFWYFKKIIPSRDRFWADPHVFFKDNKYYIFIEEYIYKKKKAHISVIEMDQSGKYSDPVKVLEEPFHLSYPHVFKHNETVFMIPETSQSKSINLYECTNFPNNWKHRATLIDSVEAVDSTILFYKNKWWLFTTIAEPEGSSKNELFVFYSDNLWSQNWTSHPKNPVISDIKRARSAGKIFEHEGKIYRPSQCGSPYYAYGVKLNEILVLTENEYLEKEITFIEPNWDKKLNGIHTFCHQNRLTLIDGDCYKFVI